MDDEKKFNIEVVFKSNFTDEEKIIIIDELDKAITFIFNRDYLIGEIVKIIIMRNYDSGDGKIINGCFTSKSRVIELGTVYINNIRRFRNLICHELTHTKFTFELIKKMN